MRVIRFTQEDLKMNARIMTRLAVFAVAGSLLAGCASQQGTNTAVGTGVGAGTGAALGAIFGGGKGAAIGAATGAAVGGITGYNWQAIRNKISGDSKGTGTQVTEQQDGSLKVNIPNSISFDTNSYAIKPSFAPVLTQVAQTLNQNPEVVAQVVGHTDSTGQPAYNQTLSVNRAQSVVNQLAQDGVAQQRLGASGMGANQPIADNNTEAGRAQNRRVEIYLRAMAQHAQ
jgi:outer membrane protein OmpA-like peptidoglycan-associated protein